ncbi:MAG TPA: GNAT family protein [Mycobacteriales bacterium]|jgi:RimJ/RimL family protein N-acetyltransferase|nr:GNAT family protein [Mycobacteriales bacterium]
MADEPAVRLRRLASADLDLLVRRREVAEQEDEYGFFGHLPTTGLRGRYAEHGLLSPDDGALMVDTADGETVGEVTWHAVHYGPPPASRAANIGIEIFPAHRGRGYGTAAQRALAAYLLATYPINRVEASTDVANVAEQRSLEKAGFTREGVLRGAQWRAGAWHDLVGYSVIRSD